MGVLVQGWALAYAFTEGITRPGCGRRSWPGRAGRRTQSLDEAVLRVRWPNRPTGDLRRW